MVVLEEQQVEKSPINTTEQKQSKLKNTRIILWIIIVVLLLMLYILCYRVGKIGYNYLSIWDVSQIAPIVIKAEDMEVNTKKEMNIFKGVIAPMSKGTFNFSIRNDTNEDVVYNVQFLDEMTNFVNMKYRLKMDNIYIVGNKDKYVGIDELDIKNIISPKNSASIYTLEWFWESDDEKDTYIGTREEAQYYTLALHIYSSAYKNGGE